MTTESLALVTRVQAALCAPGMPFETETTPTGPRYLNGPRTLREFLESSRVHSDRVFLHADSGSWTFHRHYEAAAALAHRYVETYGLRPGDRVAIAMRNLPEWQIAFWAAQLAGLVAVPLNAWWGQEELTYALDDCAPGAIVADGERMERMSGWAAERSVPLLTVGVPESAERFEDLVLSGTPAPEVRIEPSDQATLMYTSGTTGRPKGVAATHSAWCAAALSPRFFAATSVLCAGGSLDQLPVQTVLMTFPFFHVAAFTTMLPLMTGGGTAILMRKWDPAAALKLIAEHRVTSYVGVPTTAMGLLDAADAAGKELPSLLMVSTGGAAAPPELARRVHRLFGGRVEARNGYGLTETCGGVLANVGPRYLEHPESIGRPAPATEVRTAGPAGEALAEGEVGELWLRGQSIFSGYRNQPDATATAFAGEGWFRTGDLAFVRDGEVYVVDRLKDMVIRGGENVYCVEVEGVLTGHPAVADAAVLGVPHPTQGEEVAAMVVLRAGAVLDAAAVREHVAERLAAFKVPAHVVFRADPLPRNPTGKILKRELRAEIGQLH